MGALAPELEAGITYMTDNSAAVIADTLKRVIQDRWYERWAAKSAQETYGPEAVANSLDTFLTQVIERSRAARK